MSQGKEKRGAVEWKFPAAGEGVILIKINSIFKPVYTMNRLPSVL